MLMNICDLLATRITVYCLSFDGIFSAANAGQFSKCEHIFEEHESVDSDLEKQLQPTNGLWTRSCISIQCEASSQQLASYKK